VTLFGVILKTFILDLVGTVVISANVSRKSDSL
jgi:hypothetical protein